MARYQAVRHVPIGNGFKAYQRPILERMRTFPISETAAATALLEWQKCLAGTGDPTARDNAMRALREALPAELVAEADEMTADSLDAGTSRGLRLTAEEVTAALDRAGLNPVAWNLSEILRAANSWIGGLLVDLAAGEDPTWSAAERAEHRAEFGALSAVDFLEQCVIEAGPDTAPWQELQARITAGEFDAAKPVWAAPNPLQH